jgi:hypothetical protein
MLILDNRIIMVYSTVLIIRYKSAIIISSNGVASLDYPRYTSTKIHSCNKHRQEGNRDFCVQNVKDSSTRITNNTEHSKRVCVCVCVCL